ncbi:MAG TPA: nucleoside-diphosphate kinase [Chloroflexi bacterium]|nr:nucleoside-diphosphate kinase [Chloroflexota bacterium]HCU98493.1 nucleoside-diphosphate kinase [Chloroflexota bacterium]
METTLLLVKPDGVQRGLVGTIISKIEQRGLNIVGMKMLSVSNELAEAHYAIHEDKPFYNGLISYITSSPVVAIAWQGNKAVSVLRQVLGSTNPTEANPGTIRGDYAIDIGRNLTHGSDSAENGKIEVNLWFTPEELIEWTRNDSKWIFE